MVKGLLQVVKAVGYKTAKGAANSASAFYINQPKEPESVKKLKKVRD